MLKEDESQIMLKEDESRIMTHRISAKIIFLFYVNKRIFGNPAF